MELSHIQPCATSPADTSETPRLVCPDSQCPVSRHMPRLIRPTDPANLPQRIPHNGDAMPAKPASRLHAKVRQYIESVEDKTVRSILSKVVFTRQGQELIAAYADMGIVLGNMETLVWKKPALKPMLDLASASTTPQQIDETDLSPNAELTGKIRVLLNPRFILDVNATPAQINGTLANELVNARQYAGLLKSIQPNQPLTLKTFFDTLKDQKINVFKWELASTLAEASASTNTLNATQMKPGRSLNGRELNTYFKQKYPQFNGNIFIYFLTTAYAQRLGLDPVTVFQTKRTIPTHYSPPPDTVSLSDLMQEFAPEFDVDPSLLTKLEDHFSMAILQAYEAMATIQNNNPNLSVKEKSQLYVKQVLKQTQPRVDDLNADSDLEN
jgi:hypothetical protein